MRVAMALLTCAMAAVAAPATRPAASTQPTVENLTAHPVVGELGLPLGTVTEIRATILAGSKLEMKRYESSYLLRVTEIAGRAVDRRLDMPFEVPGLVNVRLAANRLRLYELKIGKKTGRLDAKQIAEIEKGYVGKQVRLAVYETGAYSGIPRNLPSDLPVWQGHDFSFETRLVVLAERDR